MIALFIYQSILVMQVPHSAIRIYWEHIYELHSELSKKDYKFSKPQVEKTDWETLELSITDPFSNRIIFWADA